MLIIKYQLRKLLYDKRFTSENEKLEFLVSQPSIKDEKNGMTLCRECHKKEHNNWGSKINP